MLTKPVAAPLVVEAPIRQIPTPRYAVTAQPDTCASVGRIRRLQKADFSTTAISALQAPFAPRPRTRSSHAQPGPTLSSLGQGRLSNASDARLAGTTPTRDRQAARSAGPQPRRALREAPAPVSAPASSGDSSSLLAVACVRLATGQRTEPTPRLTLPLTVSSSSRRHALLVLKLTSRATASPTHGGCARHSADRMAEL
jgi:hypothetical protein